MATKPRGLPSLLRANRVPIGVFVYGLVMALLFVFVVYERSGAVAPAIDVNGFGHIARSILQGDGFSIGFGPTIRRAPLYPYLAAAALWLSGRDPTSLPDAAFYRPVLIANSVMFAFTCVIVWSITRRTFGERVALLAAGLTPLIPQSLRYVGRTEVESLIELCVALLAYTGLNLALRPSATRAAAFGLVAAATTLAKPVAQLYPLVAAALLLWHWRRERLPLRAQVGPLAVMLLCFVLPLVPWSLRNASVTNGAFRGISSNAAGEFLRGYVNAQPKYYLLQQDFGGTNPNVQTWDPEANDYEEKLLNQHGMAFYRTGFDPSGRMFLIPEPPPGHTSVSFEVQKDEIEGVEMKRRVLADPLEFVGKFVVQLGTFWYIAETRAKSLFVGFCAFVMLAFAALGMLDARRRGALTWPIVLVIAYFNAIYAAFLALGRYSMPLFPTLATLSAGGIAALITRFRRTTPQGSEPEAPRQAVSGERARR